MRPRQFSIACSVKVTGLLGLRYIFPDDDSQKYPKQIQLCVAIVQYRTKIKAPRRGVCTTYLAALRPGKPYIF